MCTLPILLAFPMNHLDRVQLVRLVCQSRSERLTRMVQSGDVSSHGAGAHFVLSRRSG